MRISLVGPDLAANRQFLISRKSPPLTLFSQGKFQPLLLRYYSPITPRVSIFPPSAKTMTKGKARSRTGGYRGGRGAAAASPNKSRRSPLTHFLCLPLVTEASRAELEQAFVAFRGVVGKVNEMERGPGRSGVADETGESPKQGALFGFTETNNLIPKNAIRPVGTLHLTLGVMSLESVERVQEAIALLQGLDVQQFLADSIPRPEGSDSKEVAVAEVHPLRVSLNSLVSMHPPTKTTVLYAEPRDPTNRLQSFGEKLRAFFVESGFLTPEDRPLRMHATVINTIYVKASTRSTQRQLRELAGPGSAQNTDASEPVIAAESSAVELPAATQKGSRGSRKTLTLDATLLLEQCKDFTWIKDLHIERVAICKMGAGKILDSSGTIVDERYEEIASVTLPQ